MLPFARLTRVLVRKRPPPVDSLIGASLTFRVWPNDLDLNRHMNNSRYLALMDLGRYDLTRRIGLLQTARRNKWFPVVAAQTIRFRKSLAPFERFELHTRVAAWDAKSFYLEQTFTRGEELVAEAMVRARFLSRDGALTTAKVLEQFGETRPSPALPDAKHLV